MKNNRIYTSQFSWEYLFKNSIRESNTNFVKMIFRSNGGNFRKWISNTASNSKESTGI